MKILAFRISAVIESLEGSRDLTRTRLVIDVERFVEATDCWIGFLELILGWLRRRGGFQKIHVFLDASLVYLWRRWCLFDKTGTLMWVRVIRRWEKLEGGWRS